MDNLENKTVIQPDATDLQTELETLRHLVVSVLILMIVVSGTLSIYLLRQWRTTTKELANMRPQVQRMVEVYQKDEFPWMQDILKKFTEYGRTHPDYMPILAKYNVKPNAPGAPSTSATPPGAAPNKK
jgi:hypothetical protein